MITIFGRDFEHLTITRELTRPVSGYVVRTDEGYYIRKPTFDEGVYKTTTTIYETDDVNAIEVVSASELPEDAVVMGVGENTETV